MFKPSVLKKALSIQGVDKNKLLTEYAQNSAKVSDDLKNPIALAARQNREHALKVLLTQQNVDYGVLARNNQFKILINQLITEKSIKSLELIFTHMKPYAHDFYSPNTAQINELIADPNHGKLLSILIENMSLDTYKLLVLDSNFIKNILRNINDQNVINTIFARISVEDWNHFFYQSSYGTLYFKALLVLENNAFSPSLMKLWAVPNVGIFINTIRPLDWQLKFNPTPLNLINTIRLVDIATCTDDMRMIKNATRDSLNWEQVEQITDTADQKRFLNIIFYKHTFEWAHFFSGFYIGNQYGQDILLNISRFKALLNLLALEPALYQERLMMFLDKNNSGNVMKLSELPLDDVLFITGEIYKYAGDKGNKMAEIFLRCVNQNDLLAYLFGPQRASNKPFFDFLDNSMSLVMSDSFVLQKFVEPIFLCRNPRAFAKYFKVICQIDNRKLTNYYGVMTLLHHAIETRSLPHIRIVMENMPKAQAKNLLLMEIRSKSPMAKQLGEASVTPIGYALHLNFPEAIPTMLIAAFKEEWVKALPDEVFEFLQHRRITSDLHKLIITGLIAKYPQVVDQLRPVYQNFSPAIAQMFTETVAQMPAVVNPVRFSNHKRNAAAMQPVSSYHEFTTRFAPNTTIPDHRLELVFTAYAERTGRLQALIDLGEISNQNNREPVHFTAAENAVLETAVESHNQTQNKRARNN